MARLLTRIGNPLTAALLRSPFHGLLSRRFMLITVRGRRTGATYTTPVNYVRDDDVLTVISNRDRTWWRNLRGGAEVTMRLRGRDVSGVGSLLTDDAAVAPALADYFERLMGRRPAPERAAAMAPAKVVILIRLQDTLATRARPPGAPAG